MEIQAPPSIDTTYTTPQGDSLVVIGRGTQGIIVEYIDGRVELIPFHEWCSLQLSLASIH